MPPTASSTPLLTVNSPAAPTTTCFDRPNLTTDPQYKTVPWNITAVMPQAISDGLVAWAAKQWGAGALDPGKTVGGLDGQFIPLQTIGKSESDGGIWTPLPSAWNIKRDTAITNKYTIWRDHMYGQATSPWYNATIQQLVIPSIQVRHINLYTNPATPLASPVSNPVRLTIGNYMKTSGSGNEICFQAPQVAITSPFNSATPSVVLKSIDANGNIKVTWNISVDGGVSRWSDWASKHFSITTSTTDKQEIFHRLVGDPGYTTTTNWVATPAGTKINYTLTTTFNIGQGNNDIIFRDVTIWAKSLLYVPGTTTNQQIKAATIGTIELKR